MLVAARPAVILEAGETHLSSSRVGDKKKRAYKLARRGANLLWTLPSLVTFCEDIQEKR